MRHGSWNAPETLELLRTSGVSFWQYDQPIIGRLSWAVGSDYLGRRIRAASWEAQRHMVSGRCDNSRTRTIQPIFYTTEELGAVGYARPKSRSGLRDLSSPTITFRESSGEACTHQHLEGIESESA